MDDDKQPTVPKVLKTLARLLGTDVKSNRLDIPEKYGKGYCAGFVFNEDIHMLISNYELYENVVIENPEVDTSRRRIFFKFQNIFPKSDMAKEEGYMTKIPSVLIATSRINTDEVIIIHSNTAVINIEVNADYLKGLFDSSKTSPVLQSLLQNAQPLLFEQILFSSLQRIVDELVIKPTGGTFELFFLRIKAEELICRLLMELERRDEQRIYALNSHDIQALYAVKEWMLKHLDTPPVISELSASVHMSPSKLKRLFKQIFGNSIFNYYQEFRMKEAARLLREGNLSVSDVGYKLGFINLSHFSRVFKQHIGIKPKKYSATKDDQKAFND